MHEGTDCLSARYPGYRGKDYSHVELDATENIGSNHRASNIRWVNLEDEEDTDEADNCYTAVASCEPHIVAEGAEELT